MDLDYTKKALLFVDGEYRDHCSRVFSSMGYDVGEGVLDSPDAICTAAKQGVLASFFRSQLISLIERKGVPSYIVLAFPSRMGLSKETDPDGAIIARALFFSLIVIGMDQKYSSSRFNIFVITKGEKRVMTLNKSPEKFLSILNVANEKIKLRIDNLIEDKAAFARSFVLKVVDSDDFAGSPHLMISGFISQVNARNKLENKVAVLAAPAISTKNNAPADVIYLFDDGEIWRNGEISPEQNEYKNLSAGVFHITGSLTTKNIKDVMNRIRTEITGGIRDRKFLSDDEITITMGIECSIDATAAAALAQLMVTELSRYKKKKLLVSSVNDGILRKSQGYSMIREYIRVDTL